MCLGEMNARVGLFIDELKGDGAGLEILADIKQGYYKHLLSSYCLLCIVLSTWHTLFY